jgi:glycosyltransferase involved in cell wall biosynthesis
MTGGPTVSIVIPAYNEERTIRACVVAALEQTVPAHEIVIVDNRSTDNTRAMLDALLIEFPDAPIVITEEHVQGIIPARNRGFEVATGDVYGRIDADSLLEPGWVEAVQQTFSDTSVAAATGPVIYYDMPLRRWGARADDRIRKAMLKLTREYHFLLGCNMAIRATAWDDIRDDACLDAVDEMHEDLDLSIHLFERGHKVTYNSDIVSGMSARRLDSTAKSYYKYVGRWERTYDNHGIHNPALRAPMVVFSAIYPVLKGVRKQHLKTMGADAPSPSAWAG